MFYNDIMFYNNDNLGTGHFEGLAVLWEDGTKVEKAANFLSGRSLIHNRQ